MSDNAWTEIDHAIHGRIRFRSRPPAYDGMPTEYDLETWRGQEWRRVNSLQARDWFAIGMQAAETGG